MATRARRGALPPIEIQYHLPPEDQPLVELLVTEDDKPVDNLFAEKQRRLLVDPLYASWRGGPTARPFVAASDVGIFPAVREPPLAPDAFLSVDVHLAEPLDTRGRAYFFWEYGKPPDVAVEVVSNHKGGEITRKLQRYAQMGIPYYAVFDRSNRLRRGMLRLFHLTDTGYEPASSLWMPEVALGFTIWHGPYEEAPNIWLRWCNEAGEVYATGAELALQAQRDAEKLMMRAEAERFRAEQERFQAAHERSRAMQAQLQAEAEYARAEQERSRAEQAHARAEQERSRAEQERSRAEQERSRAEQERSRAEQLAARLRALGFDPDA